MKILLHSSKTMKPESSMMHELTTPLFIDQARYLNEILRRLDVDELATLMDIKKELAQKVKTQILNWRGGSNGTAAVLTFRGDIYSGLSAAHWSGQDAIFAQEHLMILSGLYGSLRPFDVIMPYRLEMGYKLQLDGSGRLSKYWENQLLGAMDISDTYINLTAKEYFTVIEKQLGSSNVISPKFLTVSKKTQLPVFVTMHAKIARGSFANWLITHQVDNPDDITKYDQLNYQYNSSLSTPTEPVFVCEEFGGLGLSVRLK